MFSVQNYICSIKSHLEKYSDLLISNLQTKFKINFTPDVEMLEFHSFFASYKFAFSITMLSICNEVFYDENDSTFYGGEVLPEVEYFQLEDSELFDFYDFYEQNKDIIIPQEQKIFTDWFSNCWSKAGGDVLKLPPSYLMLTDDNKSFDLKNNQWIVNKEKSS